MTIRTVLLTAALAASLTSPATAQRYKIPDSLAYLGFPDDPVEYAERYAAGEFQIILNSDNMYRAGGCRSDGRWTAAALDALEAIAETDVFMRMTLAGEYGYRLKNSEKCPADLPVFEAWITRTLRQQYERGIFYLEFAKQAEKGGPSAGHAGVNLMGALWASTTPEAHALILEIALDPKVHFAVERELAARLARHVGVLCGSEPCR